MANSKLIPFNYFGGKYRHLDFVMNRLPESFSYVEVFGGSAVVLINRKPSRIETYNDINEKVVNFFRVLRERPDELLSKIYLTPYCKEEYQFCYQNINEGNEVERARRFFVTVCQSYNGTYTRQSGWKMSTKVSKAIVCEAVARWLSKIPNLVEIIERLRRVQISNDDFRLVFEKHDTEQTLFYCDPPYMHDVRCNSNEYEYEMSESDHLEFCKLAIQAKGMVAVSGYDTELYNDMLKGFYKSVAREKRDTMHHSTRQEVLWTSYDPGIVKGQLLFN